RAASPEIDRLFAGDDVAVILSRLDGASGLIATEAREAMRKGSPLSMACTAELLVRARAADSLPEALRQEYHFTARAIGQADLLEGIRAQLIDRDRSPRW